MLLSPAALVAQPLTLVELNCENLFDTRHDSLKQDQEFLPEGVRHWTPRRYWRKLDNTGRAIVACADDGIPDLVALCEVENDTVLHDLTRRSLLRTAGYEYVMTSSPDLRGIDVALLYRPLTFAPICVQSLPVAIVRGMRPTRDILYVAGRIRSGDTLHVFVVHAPSKFGGTRHTRPFRMQTVRRLCDAVDSVRRCSPGAPIVVAGDLNEADGEPAVSYVTACGLHDLTPRACGSHGARGTYRYKGRWSSIDHIFVSDALLGRLDSVHISDAPFLLEPDRQYGGVKPRRTYVGYRYQPGFSDHLPLVARFHWP